MEWQKASFDSQTHLYRRSPWSDIYWISLCQDKLRRLAELKPAGDEDKKCRDCQKMAERMGYM